MGFGVTLLGFAFLLMHEIGGGFFAALVMGYGFFLTARLNKTFLHAAISSLFILPRGAVQILATVGLINIDTMPLLNTVTFVLFIAAWATTSVFWLKGVIEIAIECGSAKMERQARWRLVASVFVLMLIATGYLLNTYGILGLYAGPVLSGVYLLQYALLCVQIAFMHTCFVLITSERQYAKDKQQIAIERAKAIEKANKAKQEGARRSEKRR